MRLDMMMKSRHCFEALQAYNARSTERFIRLLMPLLALLDLAPGNGDDFAGISRGPNDLSVAEPDAASGPPGRRRMAASASRHAARRDGDVTARGTGAAAGACRCLGVRRQQLPPKNETGDRRNPAHGRENYRESGKRAWKQADRNHKDDRLESFSDAGQIINRFLALP
jgi:hypothetical protein